MPALEAVVGEVPGALLRRAEVRVELPHGPPDEAVGRAQQGAAAALRRHLQLPHATVLCVCEGAGRGACNATKPREKLLAAPS